MRIARVLTRLNLGGPARQVLASDPLLAAAGHTLKVYCGQAEPGEGDLFDALRARGIDAVRVPALARGVSPARDLWALAFLRGELEHFQPDVVHTHASKAGALGRRAARRTPGAARVHTFHGHVLEGYFPDFVSRRLIAQERALARECQRVVAVSHATAEDLLRLGVVAADKLVVIPPGIELEPLLAIERPPWGSPEFTAARNGPLRRELGARAEDVLVGVVGRLAEVKQPELALAAFELLAERYAALQLVFIGDGELFRPLERRIRALPPALRARAHMLGARSDMSAVWRELDICLLSSRSEGLPVALIEAHAAGLPAVATAVGGVAEVVAHERTGFLGANATELSFGLAKLLDDPRFAQACGARGRLRVRERHGAAALAGRLTALYEQVLAEVACGS